METTPPFFGWDYPPSVCSPASYSRTLGLFVFGNQKSKRPPSGEALEGSDSHCLNYSALVLRAALGRRGMGKPLKSADARSCIVESRGEK